MKIYSLFILTLVAFYSCDNRNGLFGHSKSKEDARANGSTIEEYIPDKSIFTLLDGTKMQIDTAWTELSFTYQSGNRILDSSDGYQFAIPVKNDSLQNFTFTFGLLDTTNRMFTNPGPEEDGFCRLRPKKLFDEIEVILEQKDTDTLNGWINPIITDTILFKKVKPIK